MTKPCSSATALFRIQLNLMNGPLLAYLFPETESRRVCYFKLIIIIKNICLTKKKIKMHVFCIFFFLLDVC